MKSVGRYFKVEGGRWKVYYDRLLTLEVEHDAIEPHEDAKAAWVAEQKAKAEAEFKCTLYQFATITMEVDRGEQVVLVERILFYRDGLPEFIKDNG